jgi:energy-converting hydrogenase B subunit D
MTAIVAVVLVLAALAGTAVVHTRNPFHQAIVASFYGLILGILFIVYQAPDVALSQITVGAVALPLMILLALTKIAQQERARDQERGRRRDARGDAEPGERGGER